MRDFIREHVVERAIEMGCDYIQMDAPNYGQSYTDPEVMAVMRGRRPRPGRGADRRRRDRQLAVRGHHRRDARPACLSRQRPRRHLVRRRRLRRLRRRCSRASTNYDTLLLEYDTPRAGDFSPLQHVLPDTDVVLGLLTTKEGALEDAALIEQRIREAAHFVPLERLALSTQCGFASAGAGNPITPERAVGEATPRRRSSAQSLGLRTRFTTRGK